MEGGENVSLIVILGDRKAEFYDSFFYFQYSGGKGEREASTNFLMGGFATGSKCSPFYMSQLQYVGPNL